MCPRELEEKTKEWLALVRPYLSDRKVSATKFQPSASSLLVIDMQRYFLEKESHAFIPSAGAVLGNVKTLISVFHRAGRPVLFTRHALLKDEDPGTMGRWWGDVLRDVDPLSAIAEGLTPHAKDAVLRKSQYSAFVGTALEEVLRSAGTSQIVVAGVQTHLCCEGTARDAFMKGFDVFVVIDATASRTEELHVAALKTLAHGFAMPVTTEEVARWLA